MIKKLSLALIAALIVFAVWLFATPSPIDPAAYDPAPGQPLIGKLTPNEELERSSLIGEGKLEGPEDVAIDAEGRLYVGTEDGRIMRITANVIGEETIETWAVTGGRPFGLHFDAEGRLVIADGDRGLLRVDETAEVELLTASADGQRYAFTDDLDIGSDGTIYFSDASSRFGPREYLYDLLEARPHGRLLAYDPETDTVRTLMDGLYFANGVALSENEDFVLVAETYRYRIQRYWLTGPKAGQSEIFVDELPGFPDGVASDRAGTFWVALFTVRNPLMDRLHPLPWAKRALAKLPRALWPKPEPYGFAVALDETGRIVQSLHDTDGSWVREVTSVQPHGDGLFLGTLHGNQVARYPLE